MNQTPPALHERSNVSHVQRQEATHTTAFSEETISRVLAEMNDDDDDDGRDDTRSSHT